MSAGLQHDAILAADHAAAPAVARHPLAAAFARLNEILFLLAALALVAALFGFAMYFDTHDVRWAIGAVFIMLSWPYTFFAIVPMNNRILAVSANEPAAAREMVRTWGLMQYGQTAIGAAACAIFLWAL